MPYTMCPCCATVMHLSVASVAKWFAELHPESDPRHFVSVLCFYCDADIGVGDEVVTREFVGTKPDQPGVVRHVQPGRNGSLFVVLLESGEEVTLIRAALTKRSFE